MESLPVEQQAELMQDIEPARRKQLVGKPVPSAAVSAAAPSTRSRQEPRAVERGAMTVSTAMPAAAGCA